MAKAFGNYIVLPFVNNVNSYLTHLGIDMGMDDNIQYNITVNGGQVNLSQDNSTLNTVQNNSDTDFAKMQNFINDIIKSMKKNGIPDNQVNQISETLTAIKEEMSKSKPKKNVVKLLLDGLNNSTILLDALPEIATRIDNFAKYLAPFIN